MKDKKQITHPEIIEYLTKRGISLHIGKQYLNEGQVLNKDTDKTFFALGRPNGDGGYELRNPFFKGCIHRRPSPLSGAINVIRKTSTFLSVWMDYLSIITEQEGERFEGYMIILNYLTSLNMVTLNIHNY